jgi:hypothetical protein
MCAQDRKALEDSVIVGGISRHSVDLVLGETKMEADDRLVMHWTFADYVKGISREPLADFSDEELNQILAYYRTDAFRCLSSETFINAFINNINKAIESEVGQGPHFSYAVREKGYGTGLDAAFRNTVASIRPVIDDMLGEDGKVISQARRYGIPATQIELMLSSVRKVNDNLFNVFKLTLMNYMDQATLQPACDFALSPVGQKYAAYCQNIHSMADVSSESFLLDFQAVLKNRKANTPQLKQSLADYVALSRSWPEYFSQPLRPCVEMPMGESRYQGETHNRRPHGKGRLTDKKGVVYEGDFKDGKRHGIITVTKPGKKTETQFWVEDRYNKDVPVGKGEDGKPKPVLVEDGMRWGEGSLYDEDTKTRWLGVFIDGKLNGKGQVTEPGRTVAGEFVDGVCVNGTVTWKNPAYKVMSFNGMMAGDSESGVREWVDADEGRREVHTGVFKYGLQDGLGERSIAQENNTTVSTGYFAYGGMYGKGSQRQERINEDNGIRESSVYEGNFYAGVFQGEGCLKVSMTDIPDAAWTFSRCGVNLPGAIVKSLEIVMEGTFDNGNFKQGKVSYSDGSWFEGVFGEVGLAEGDMYRLYADGSYYQGGCLDGKFHGYGVMHNQDGTEYKGRYEYGEPVVKKEEPKPVRNNNVIRYDQQTYEFRSITAGYGNATLIKPAGVKIMVRTSVTSLKVTCRGRFRGDTFLEGKVTMTDGNWLEGVFEDGILIQGKGKTVDKYRTVYEGDIRNGYPHGEGKCTYTDGTWFVGKFANGNRMGGTHYSADGKVIKVYK